MAYNTSVQIIFVPLLENNVPMGVRQAIEYEQQEGVVKQEKDMFGVLYFDPTGIAAFADLAANMVKKVNPIIRKKGLENFLSKNKHEVISYKNGKAKANIYIMQGAQYNDTELHIAEKLAKAGLHVMFPSQGDLGKGRKNDVFLYDTKTYIQQKVELKSLFGETAEAVKSRIISGSGQASIIAYDVQSEISCRWFVKGLREGWGDGMQKVLVNWRGQWHELVRNDVFSSEIYKMLK